MKTKYTVPNRLFNDNLIETESWYSNGHFAVAKTATTLTGRATSKSEYNPTDESLSRIIGDCSNMIEWVNTGHIVGELVFNYRHMKVDFERVQFKNEKDEIAEFNLDYVLTFNLKKLYGENNQKRFVDNPAIPQLVIMPMRGL